MRQQIPLLPVLIVVGVLGDRVPICDGVLEVLFIGIFQRSEVEEELVTIWGAVNKRKAPARGRLWPGLTEYRQEIERVREEERPVVMKVVVPPVGDRGL